MSLKSMEQSVQYPKRPLMRFVQSLTAFFSVLSRNYCLKIYWSSRDEEMYRLNNSLRRCIFFSGRQWYSVLSPKTASIVRYFRLVVTALGIKINRGNRELRHLYLYFVAVMILTAKWFNFFGINSKTNIVGRKMSAGRLADNLPE